MTHPLTVMHPLTITTTGHRHFLAGNGDAKAGSAASSSTFVWRALVRRAGPRRTRRSHQPVGVALWAACFAPTAAAPPHRAPAVAVERLVKAQRYAPFARPATVRARVGGRIGPWAH